MLSGMFCIIVYKNSGEAHDIGAGSWRTTKLDNENVERVW